MHLTRKVILLNSFKVKAILPRFSRCKGFSLVEVVLALGVMSFGLVSIVGLLPAGLKTMHESVCTTVEAQIAQQLINDAQLTGSAAAINDSTRFYDWSGKEVSEDDRRVVFAARATRTAPASSITAKLSSGVVSTLRVRIWSVSRPNNVGDYSFILTEKN